MFGMLEKWAFSWNQTRELRALIGMWEAGSNSQISLFPEAVQAENITVTTKDDRLDG